METSNTTKKTRTRRTDLEPSVRKMMNVMKLIDDVTMVDKENTADLRNPEWKYKREFRFTEMLGVGEEQIPKVIREAYTEYLEGHQFYKPYLAKSNLDDLTDEQILSMLNQSFSVNDHIDLVKRSPNLKELMKGLTVATFTHRIISSMEFPKEYWGSNYKNIRGLLGKRGLKFTVSDHQAFIIAFEKGVIDMKARVNKGDADIADDKNELIDTDEKMLSLHIIGALREYVKQPLNLHPLLMYSMSNIYKILKLTTSGEINIETAADIENKILRIMNVGLKKPLMNEEQMSKLDDIAAENYKKMSMIGKVVVVPRPNGVGKEAADKVFKEHLNWKDYEDRR